MSWIRLTKEAHQQICSFAGGSPADKDDANVPRLDFQWHTKVCIQSPYGVTRDEPPTDSPEHREVAQRRARPIVFLVLWRGRLDLIEIAGIAPEWELRGQF